MTCRLSGERSLPFELLVFVTFDLLPMYICGKVIGIISYKESPFCRYSKKLVFDFTDLDL